jgi:hypothetical protein
MLRREHARFAAGITTRVGRTLQKDRRNMTVVLNWTAGFKRSR